MTETRTEPPCLHCELLEMASRHMTEHHLSVNEAILRISEALGDLLSGVGEQEDRQALVACHAEIVALRMTEGVAERERRGIPPYTVVSMQ